MSFSILRLEINIKFQKKVAAETQMNIAGTTFTFGLTNNQVERLQPSLLFSILNRGWKGGVGGGGGYYKNWPPKEGLIREGGLIEVRGGGGGLIELLRYLLPKNINKLKIMEVKHRKTSFSSAISVLRQFYYPFSFKYATQCFSVFKKFSVSLLRRPFSTRSVFETSLSF